MLLSILDLNEDLLLLVQLQNQKVSPELLSGVFKNLVESLLKILNSLDLMPNLIELFLLVFQGKFRSYLIADISEGAFYRGNLLDNTRSLTVFGRTPDSHEKRSLSRIYMKKSPPFS